ncbi:MAG: hypothetical protein JXQ96_08415 [Cyclobacteriaceae bacterium]
MSNDLYLKALEYDKQGDWDKSHRVVQDISTDDAAWIHAYLHRKEGDSSNAGYWYRRAGKEFYNGSLEDEWQQLHDYFSGSE